MGLINFFLKRKLKKLDLNIAKSPQIRVPNPIFNEGFHSLNVLLKDNIMPPLGDHSDIWARPAPKFLGAYLWDSSFIAQAWKLWDPIIGFRILKPFVEFQAKNGRMPHAVFFGRKVSPLSNPPFLAWAVKHILNYYPKEKYRKFFLKPLLRFTEWRRKERYFEDIGLYYWKHSYESGIDNSPRFTSVDESEEYGVENLAAIDLNSEIVLQYQSIIEMLAGKDDYKIQQRELNEDLNILLENIDKHLWDERKKIYVDLDKANGDLRTIDTITSYFPLIFRDLEKEKEKKLVDNLKNPQKYNTTIPTPTVARDSPDFIKDMWRGPVWMNTSYLIVKGLKNRGYNKLAGEFAYRLCKGVYQTWNNEGYFFEFYDPDRYDIKELYRKKGNLYKKITISGKPVTDFAGWTGDVNALLIEDVIGLHKKNNKWILEPHLPDEWLISGEQIKLKLPFYSVNLKLTIKDESEIEAHFKENEKQKKISTHNHRIKELSI